MASVKPVTTTGMKKKPSFVFAVSHGLDDLDCASCGGPIEAVVRVEVTADCPLIGRDVSIGVRIVGTEIRHDCAPS